MQSKRGRPFIGEKRLVLVTMGFSAEDLQKLREQAERKMRSYTEEIREAVRQYLEGRPS
jgi:hypothetical protein